jgi:asparagine N-glycosylation enzyme membrane subunit Stt3
MMSIIRFRRIRRRLRRLEKNHKDTSAPAVAQFLLAVLMILVSVWMWAGWQVLVGV